LGWQFEWAEVAHVKHGKTGLKDHELDLEVTSRDPVDHDTGVKHSAKHEKGGVE